MQIRLTVVDPLGPTDRGRGRAASCDVLVTAPAGTALSAVASALSSVVSGEGALSERGPVVLYAGAERLDDRRCTLGEPPLIDGAVLALGAPAEPEPHPELDDAPTQLHVTAGPDAGGVHLLHGGEIRIGRSADADVPLDDPDVSRLHCVVTVAADGQVSVADLGSTNGTLLDGVPVTSRPVRFPPGALLQVGESSLRLTPSTPSTTRVPTTPDGEGHVRVPRGEDGHVRVPGGGNGEGHVRVPGGGNGEGHVRVTRGGNGEGPVRVSTGADSTGADAVGGGRGATTPGGEGRGAAARADGRRPTPTTPDGKGRAAAQADGQRSARPVPGARDGDGHARGMAGRGGPGDEGHVRVSRVGEGGSEASTPSGRLPHARGSGGGGVGRGSVTPEQGSGSTGQSGFGPGTGVPGQGGAPRIESRRGPQGSGETRAGRGGTGGRADTGSVGEGGPRGSGGAGTWAGSGLAAEGGPRGSGGTGAWADTGSAADGGPRGLGDTRAGRGGTGARSDTGSAAEGGPRGVGGTQAGRGGTGTWADTGSVADGGPRGAGGREASGTGRRGGADVDPTGVRDREGTRAYRSGGEQYGAEGTGTHQLPGSGRRPNAPAHGADPTGERQASGTGRRSENTGTHQLPGSGRPGTSASPGEREGTRASRPGADQYSAENTGTHQVPNSGRRNGNLPYGAEPADDRQASGAGRAGAVSDDSTDLRDQRSSRTERRQGTGSYSPESTGTHQLPGTARRAENTGDRQTPAPGRPGAVPDDPTDLRDQRSSRTQRRQGTDPYSPESTGTHQMPHSGRPGTPATGDRDTPRAGRRQGTDPYGSDATGTHQFPGSSRRGATPGYGTNDRQAPAQGRRETAPGDVTDLRDQQSSRTRRRQGTDPYDPESTSTHQLPRTGSPAATGDRDTPRSGRRQSTAPYGPESTGTHQLPGAARPGTPTATSDREATRAYRPGADQYGPDSTGTHQVPSSGRRAENTGDRAPGRPGAVSDDPTDLREQRSARTQRRQSTDPYDPESTGTHQMPGSARTGTPAATGDQGTSRSGRRQSTDPYSPEPTGTPQLPGSGRPDTPTASGAQGTPRAGRRQGTGPYDSDATNTHQLPGTPAAPGDQDTPRAGHRHGSDATGTHPLPGSARRGATPLYDGASDRQLTGTDDPAGTRDRASHRQAGDPYGAESTGTHPLPGSTRRGATPLFDYEAADDRQFPGPDRRGSSPDDAPGTRERASHRQVTDPYDADTTGAHQVPGTGRSGAAPGNPAHPTDRQAPGAAPGTPATARDREAPRTVHHQAAGPYGSDTTGEHRIPSPGNRVAAPGDREAGPRTNPAPGRPDSSVGDATDSRRTSPRGTDAASDRQATQGRSGNPAGDPADRHRTSARSTDTAPARHVPVQGRPGVTPSDPTDAPRRTSPRPTDASPGRQAPATVGDPTDSRRTSPRGTESSPGEPTPTDRRRTPPRGTDASPGHTSADSRGTESSPGEPTDRRRTAARGTGASPGESPADSRRASSRGGAPGEASQPRDQRDASRAGRRQGADPYGTEPTGTHQLPGAGSRQGGPGKPEGSPRRKGGPGKSDGSAAGRRRGGVPDQGGDVAPGPRKRGGFSAWARWLTGVGRGERDVYDRDPEEGREVGDVGEQVVAGGVPSADTWPDPAALLLTALGPGPRLWERGAGHPEALTVRLGTADRAAPDGLLPAVPVTADLREVGALGLAGPRDRLSGLARAVLAQLAALHAPESLEIVLISADRSRSEAERIAEWGWLGWLPHLRPAHGQDCRLLLAYDREQAAARTGELLRRLDEPSAGPYTVLVVDGDPGGAGLRDAVGQLASEGPRAGIHVVCLAEADPASPASPVTDTYEAACAAAPTFRECGAVALLSGDVATALRLMRVARAPQEPTPVPVGPGTVAAVDAVSSAWAERFARALAPLRQDGTAGAGSRPRVSLPLPQAARLLDELGLARATPASLMARWADAADDPESVGGRAVAVLGAGPRGPVTADLVAEGPHLLIEGPAGSGRTELLRALVASLAAAERPDRLGVVLVDGHGEGLRVCTDVPHVTTHLTANDPVRMREFAQSLSAELKRRAEWVGRGDFAARHAGPSASAGRVVAPREPSSGAGDVESASSATIRLRPTATRQQPSPSPSLPRLVVVVDDLDALVSPALGSPGRPAAGSVMRALEAVAREGERLGVHLVAAAGPGGRTAETEPSRLASLRVTLDAPSSGPDEPAPGRGRLTRPDGTSTPFQGGRVTGRIPRTATLRPTVVALDWPRMGDPPTRRPVRELGNGPTDLALLASALERAAKQVAAQKAPSLL
ncbi:FtsK/SpoIIIE domain-containing protein [Streptomyces sp. NPDC087425]|uniref:FtsK/SpoIIIE domain-containing protein n=1 Tax=Streptomyces sp. NPDC087425 TaxID=3365787 RepID=UPI0038265EDD